MMRINNINHQGLFLCLIFIYIPGVSAGSSGEQLYMQNCMVCHGDDGTGGMPGVINLEKNRTWSTLDDAALLTRLKQGIQKPGSSISMPAKGGNVNLTDNELKEIIRYIRYSFLK